MIGWMTPRARTVGRISEMSGGFLPWRILALLTDSLSKGMKSSFMALVLLGWTGSEIIIVLESRLMPSEPVFRAGRARASSASRRKLVVSIIGGGTRAIEAAGGGGDGTEIGRAHVCTPVTNAHPVCRLLLEKKKIHLVHKHI